jgi:hypothetical protein
MFITGVISVEGLCMLISALRVGAFRFICWKYLLSVGLLRYYTVLRYFGFAFYVGLFFKVSIWLSLILLILLIKHLMEFSTNFTCMLQDNVHHKTPQSIFFP